MKIHKSRTFYAFSALPSPPVPTHRACCIRFWTPRINGFWKSSYVSMSRGIQCIVAFISFKICGSESASVGNRPIQWAFFSILTVSVAFDCRFFANVYWKFNQSVAVLESTTWSCCVLKTNSWSPKSMFGFCLHHSSSLKLLRVQFSITWFVATSFRQCCITW